MYSKSVDRANPGCIIFLVDQSYSMTEGIAGSPRAKCQVVESAINRFLNELVILCERGEEKPRPYFDVGLLGYTTNEDGTGALIRSFSPASLADRQLANIVELYDNPDESEDPDDMFIWYRTPPEETLRGTPMCHVFGQCFRLASAWCAQHPRSFPPVVLHLTDGEATDGDPEPEAKKLCSLATQDGNLLLFNCHLSESPDPYILFPADPRTLPDDYARMLFRMSSVMPEPLRKMASAKSVNVPPGAHAMAFNADATQLLLLINVGTQVLARPANP